MAEDQEKNIDLLVPNGKGKDCPCFAVFLRLLLKYLKNRGDDKAYEALRHRLQVCTEKAQRQEPGYECVAKAVLQEIPKIIKASDLKRVQAVLKLRVEQKNRRKQSNTEESSSPTVDTSSCTNVDTFTQKFDCEART